MSGRSGNFDTEIGRRSPPTQVQFHQTPSVEFISASAAHPTMISYENNCSIVVAASFRRLMRQSNYGPFHSEGLSFARTFVRCPGNDSSSNSTLRL